MSSTPCRVKRDLAGEGVKEGGGGTGHPFFLLVRTSGPTLRHKCALNGNR